MSILKVAEKRRGLFVKSTSRAVALQYLKQVGQKHSQKQNMEML